MRAMKMVVVLSSVSFGLLLSTAPASAGGMGACKAYAKGCKSSKKGPERTQCLTDAATADGDKGKACVDHMAKHEAAPKGAPAAEPAKVD